MPKIHTEASFGSISWKEDCPQTDGRPGCMEDSCARHPCSPSTERNINSKEEWKKNKGKGPSAYSTGYHLSEDASGVPLRCQLKPLSAVGSLGRKRQCSMGDWLHWV